VFTLRHCQNGSNWTGIWTERFIHTYVSKEEEIPRRRKLRYMCGKLGRLPKSRLDPKRKQDWKDVKESMTGSAKVDGEMRLVRRQ
jgi:hypothetical protein